MGRQSSVLAIGSVYLDINATGFPFESGFPAEKEIVGGHYEAVLGGSAANFSKTIAALGASPILIGKTGDDAIGHLLTNMMIRHGIRPALVRSKAVSTNLGINLVNRYGKRAMLVLGTANQSLRPREVVSKLDRHINKVSYLYLGGYFKLTSLTLPYFLTMIRRAKRSGVRVVLDHGRITNIVSENKVKNLVSLLRALSGTDYYLPAEKEFLRVFRARDIEQGLETFRQVSPAIVVVKQSSKGATWMVGSESMYSPAYQVKPQYTTGAGDAFNAGFIKAQMDEKSFEESIRFANATAAEKISHEDLPTIGGIEKLVRAL